MSLQNRLTRFLLTGRKRAKINRWLNRAEMRRHAIRLRTHPPDLLLGPATICNLRCPLCPTGGGTLRLKKEILEPETFRAIVSNIRLDYLFYASLFSWGEPFLNPHIFEYVRFFHDRRLFTVIHTNFCVKDYEPEFFDQVILSGLDELTVSIDGASQETYEKYRVGGDFERVVANMAGLAAAKRRRNASTPRVVYKMLLNRFNETEIDDARRIAAQVGAEFFPDERFEVPSHVQDEWLSSPVREKLKNAQNTPPARKVAGEINTYCRQLWDTLVVNADGDLFPCCSVADQAMAIGNLARDHIDTLWNSPKMIALRRYVVDPDAPAPDFPNLCHRCPFRFCTW
jgi:radical SAM protein with 4Fe4S-binding SPASM domain